MAFLSRLHDLVQRGSQFIIATHSPIILAYPKSTIFHFGADGIDEIDYTETEHFRVTRDFLNRHRQMIKILLEH